MVIPFAMLGYGIGGNIVLLIKDELKKHRAERVLSFGLLALSVLTLECVYLMIKLPLNLEYVVNIFYGAKPLIMLLTAYTIFMIPFILIGFLIVYIFTFKPAESSNLYFIDLLGAGFGAIAFFPLINNLEVFRSIVLVTLVVFMLGVFISDRLGRVFKVLIAILLIAAFSQVKEIQNYQVDLKKGWEYIPGHFDANQYKQLYSKWHPLGRTNIYEIIDAEKRNELLFQSPGTFEVNLEPNPSFSYISSNFLAGTPIYKFSKEGLAEFNSKVELFKIAFEAPYSLLEKPRVVVIGAGGGRDIFIANTHQAKEVIGAEINPGIVKAMSKNGALYEYSGGVYSWNNTKVYNLDGRHLVKKLKANSTDLIVLNGVDTFAGLSSGAYAYAESYLYTKDAVKDYLRILSNDGILNFNRWLNLMPRETLRLEAIAIEALKDLGVKDPWDNIIIGGYQGWSIVLIKKTPFAAEEKEKIEQYFYAHKTDWIFPSRSWREKNVPENFYDAYADSINKGKNKLFLKEYPFDISVVTDDKPFFYKYYKFNQLKIPQVLSQHHTGTIVFFTQILILLQSLVFIVIFIFLPLFIIKKKAFHELPQKANLPFIVYFSALGLGYMFVEISMMQRFVLLLGSPIHSITVVLSALLISTGTGSLCLGKLQKYIKNDSRYLTINFILFLLYLSGLLFLGVRIYDNFMGADFIIRAFLTCLTLFPLGFFLGAFFPMGLKTLGGKFDECIPWAWGINSGFSVLGSILSITIAQFQGFSFILKLSLVIYLVALLSFILMESKIRRVISAREN